MVKTLHKYNSLVRFLLILVFLFYKPTLFKLSSSESDSTIRQEIVNMILEGIQKMDHDQYDSAIVYLEKADSLAFLHSNLRLQANSLYNLGVAFYRVGDYVSCAEYFDKALETISKTEDSLSLAQYHLGIGILHKKKGDYKKAIDFVFNATDVLEQTKNKQLLASAYNTIAGIQNKMQNDSLALKYYQQSLSLYSQIDDSGSVSLLLNNLGNFYLERSQIKKALGYLKSSFIINKQIHDFNSLSISSNTIGKLYLQTKQFDSAYYYLNVAIESGIKAKSSVHLIESYHLKSRYFLIKNNFDSTYFYIELARPIAIKNDVKDQLLINYELSSLIFEQKGDYQKSLEYSRLFESLHEEILTKDLAKDINDLQFQYETEKKDVEIANLNAINRIKTESIKTRNTGLILISILLVISIILIILVYRAYQQKSKANKMIRFLMHEKQHRTKNNLQLLSSVLSMQSLYSPQLEKDISVEVENRVQSIVLLERLLYDTHNESEDIEISGYLNELIWGLTEAYEQHDKIKVNKDIAPLMIAAEQAKFIGLLVNEIITNSLKYAFPKTDLPKLNIRFLPQSENTYCLIISDNGPGLPNNYNSKNTNSLGMKLIDTMSRQLKGDYLIENRNGFYFKMLFKVKKGPA